MKPLAYKLRPKTFDDIIGQEHLVGPNGIIRKMVAKKKLPSLILYGKPGIGKTTLALIICEEMHIPYFTFNASTDNKALLKEYIEKGNQQEIILIIDEIHRMKKDIQDYLLPFIEDGTIIIIGITTINPYNSVNPAIRSRCLIYKLKDITEQDLEICLYRTLKIINPNLDIDEDAKTYIIHAVNGEIRFLINILENITSLINNNKISLLDAKSIIQRPSISIDKNEDNYYDTLSGLQKSIRGSDVDASLYYLGKLLASEDLLPLIRRLYVIAYEDIGLANPGIGPKVKAACEIALEVGMPEARIPLSTIVCEMALSPKSNSAYLAIDAVLSDIEAGKSFPLPEHLKTHSSSYVYPHDYPGDWVEQEYLPSQLKNKKYFLPKANSSYESFLRDRYLAIEAAKKKK